MSFEPAIPLPVFPHRRTTTGTRILTAALLAEVKIWQRSQCTLISNWLKLRYTREMEYYAAIK